MQEHTAFRGRLISIDFHEWENLRTGKNQWGIDRLETASVCSWCESTLELMGLVPLARFVRKRRAYAQEDADVAWSGSFGFGIWGSGFRKLNLGFGVEGEGCRGFGFRVECSGSGVQGVGSRV